jgi:hypothetical protein
MHIAHTKAQQTNTDEGEDHCALQQQSPAGQPQAENLTGLSRIDPKGLQKKTRLIEHDRGQKSNREGFSEPQQSSQQKRDHKANDQRLNQPTAISKTGWMYLAHGAGSPAAAH